MLDARAIPGTEQFVCHLLRHATIVPWGALADCRPPRWGSTVKTPVVRTWPPTAIDLVEVGNYDTFKKVRPRYEDPYPLSDKYFPLRPDRSATGSRWGSALRRRLPATRCCRTRRQPGCFDPMPLRRPHAAAGDCRRASTWPEHGEGTFYVADVYPGPAWSGRAGAVKSIARGRVAGEAVLDPSRPGTAAPAQQAPGMAWDDFNNKRILGTVPVEADGSAYFAVPADTFVYFQLLDERGMMVQSMRSGTIVRPGETTRLHRLPRGAPGITIARSAVRITSARTTTAQAMAWPRAELQLHGRSAAGLESLLRQLP